MGVPRAAQALAPRTGQPSRGTAGLVRGVPERYVAGADTRGRQEGWTYPWSQQVIHEISGLHYARSPISFVQEWCQQVINIKNDKKTNSYRFLP